LGWRRPSNAGWIVSTSGSVKYVVGAPSSLKSRGGVVMTLGGPMFAAGCACSHRGATIEAPMAAPTPRISLRRDTAALPSGPDSRCAMLVPYCCC